MKLSSSKVGHTKLTVEFSYIGMDGITVFLQDSVTIASYLPLTPLSPSSAETVLAVDSSRYVSYKHLGILHVENGVLFADNLLGINPASDTVLLQLVEDAKVHTYFKSFKTLRFIFQYLNFVD